MANELPLSSVRPNSRVRLELRKPISAPTQQAWQTRIVRLCSRRVSTIAQLRQRRCRIQSTTALSNQCQASPWRWEHTSMEQLRITRIKRNWFPVLVLSSSTESIIQAVSKRDSSKRWWVSLTTQRTSATCKGVNSDLAGLTNMMNWIEMTISRIKLHLRQVKSIKTIRIIEQKHITPSKIGRNHWQLTVVITL